MIRVCNNCVKDEILSAEIKEHDKTCDHCEKLWGQSGRARVLAERIDAVIQELFQLESRDIQKNQLNSFYTRRNMGTEGRPSGNLDWRHTQECDEQ